MFVFLTPLISKIVSLLERLADVDLPDPIQARRSRLLIVLVLGMAVGAAGLLILALVNSILYGFSRENLVLLQGCLLYGALAAGLLHLNRAGYTDAASIIFLSAITALVFISDAPQQVVGGRSTFLFALPVVMASVLIGPAVSFVFALLITGLLRWMSTHYGLESQLTPPAIFGLFAVALVGWLAAGSMNEALQRLAAQTKTLRRLNADLDQRVAQRTQELAAANDQLRHLDRLKNEFLATAAHELRSPLTVILGFSELLTDRSNIDSDTARRFVSMINEQANRLNVIVTDMLDIADIQSGRPLELVLEPVDLHGLAMEIAALYAARSGNHSYVVEPPGRWPAVLGDRERLGYVMNNLLSNATKYARDGGSIFIRAVPRAGFVDVSVEDEGIGMSEEEQRHLFEPFYRADASNTAVSGTGLGLAVCRQIVEAHGGSIHVRSRQGHGTTVTFSLSLWKPENDPALENESQGVDHP